MNGAFYIGATGLHSQQRALDVIANNIANINTQGFKRSEVRFSELLSVPNRDPEQSVADRPAGLAGVDVGASSRVFTQGELRPTGRQTDVAINGAGFIELMGPGGQSRLWRGGGLKINQDGLLAAANGMPLKAAITAPPSASTVSIDPDGKVWATIDGEASPTQVGQIDLVMVKDMSKLDVLGDGLYQAVDQASLASVSPGEEGGGTLLQGSVELSNVQLSDEMVTLLLLQRAYSANAQVVQAGDQLMGIANSLKR